MSIRSKLRLGFLVAVVGASLVVAGPAFGVNRDGVWRGSTSQDRTVRLEVEGDTITAVKISVHHEDCNLIVLARQRNTSFRIREDGTFTMRFFGGENAEDRVVILGEFRTHTRARGTFRSVQGNAPDCQDTVAGSWRARRVSPLG